MNDIIKTAVVNFKPIFADKKANTQKIIHYIDKAARDNADILLLPELCLTGYDALTDNSLTIDEKKALCETVTGSNVLEIKSVAEKCGLYVCFGFGEINAENCYNSAMVTTPGGKQFVYRKIHLFGSEGLFFKRGNKPLIFDTPWGKMGVGICYDTYNFPELIRYYAYSGARLYLNPTAMALEEDSQAGRDSFYNYYALTLEYDAVNTGMFLLSANLTGLDKTLTFGGGSVVMGVDDNNQFKRPKPKYYAGEIENENEGYFSASIDLSKHNPRLFKPNKLTGDVDFKPEIYSKFFATTQNIEKNGIS